MSQRTLIASLIAAALSAWLLWPGPEVIVTIPAGSSAAQASSLLKKAGVIRWATPFRLLAKAEGQDRKIEPGVYRLRGDMWPWQAVSIVGAKEAGVKVTIPEGFALWQIASRLEAEGICPAAEFTQYVSSNGLEGYLFPTTYYFEPGSPPAEITRRMYEEFSKTIIAAYKGTRPTPRMTVNQALILASIVEREAVLSKEKPMIAAVYLNRLRKRMLLGADPTVQYALGYWKKDLTLVDLKTDSPYNTYVHYGLPPGPICNPGVESFIAVLHPASTNALYFVADAKGGHVFTETGEEHLKAKRRFKRKLRQMRESAGSY